MTGSNHARKYVIIHGHFYQPPRENPWLDVVENQPSAAPDHDWNERVYDQCYRPNASSRLLDSVGMIVDLHNNYGSMSFNFGPTLFSWLEKHHPITAGKIVEADRESAGRLDGYGNAIAQVFNHIIMPLAPRRDQLTQIRWAKYFFRKRFGRDPKGMWLAETAINMETVECLISEKIEFVVLSPSQAEAFRPLQEHAGWTAASAQGIDTRRPYRVFPRDRSGKRLPGYLDVFFFDEGLSKEVSFGDLLTDAHTLGSRIDACYDRHGSHNQAVVVATDGETFGHHKPFGDMCLAFFFKKVAPQLGIVPVNFAYYLAKNPPAFEVELKNAFGEGTAWSCPHGVGRWTRDCGCKTGGEPGWKQEWRMPLRRALDWLREKIDREFDAAFRPHAADPWALRDRYIELFDSNDPTVGTKRFLESHYHTGLDECTVLLLRRRLEAQRYMLYAYTSCAWFFTDISGIETVQNLAYACRALQLGIPADDQKAVLGELLGQLDSAKSNLPDTTARTIFEQQILPFIDHEGLLAFTAALQRSLTIDSEGGAGLFGFDVMLTDLLQTARGEVTYRGVRVRVTGHHTGEQSLWSVLIAHHQNSEISGWFVPGEIDPASDRHLRPEHWISHGMVKAVTLADLFLTSRNHLAEFFLECISRDTNSRFLAWMRENSDELNVLSRLNRQLPPYCTAPMTFVFDEQWDSLISKLDTEGSEESVFTELLELTRTAQRFEISIDYNRSAGAMTRLLTAEVSSLAIEMSAERCDRIRHLLNIVDRFSIPILKNRLEDIFHPLLVGKIADLYEEVTTGSGVSAAQDGGWDVEKRELLIRLISFARRMNFNTDSFVITAPGEAVRGGT